MQVRLIKMWKTTLPILRYEIKEIHIDTWKRNSLALKADVFLMISAFLTLFPRFLYFCYYFISSNHILDSYFGPSETSVMELFLKFING